MKMAKAPQTQLEHRQAINRGTAQFVPLLLIGIVGYTTWVVIVLLCSHYLLNPSTSNNVTARPGAAIAIIVIYFVLLFPMAIAYLRTIMAVLRNPGYIPQGRPTAGTKTRFEVEPQTDIQRCCATTSTPEKLEEGSAHTNDATDKPGPGMQGQMLTTLDYDAIFGGDAPPPPGLETFYTKDVFACDPHGLPIWCSVCCNWKPDRSHHCSDVGRCVWKLDHFCPWVGGVVSETNFKFFIQFNCYTSLFTLYVMIVLAYFVAEANSKSSNTLNVHWIVVLALAGLFFLFTGGMAGKALQDTLNNLTTIDAIDHTRRTMFLAILIHENRFSTGQVTSGTSAGVSTTTRKDSENIPSTDVSTNHVQTHPWQGTITFPLYTKPASSGSSTTPPAYPFSTAPRTFAILHTPPGTNPWNLGPFENFKAVMGARWYDWFLPLRYSPCCSHDRGDSMYALGPSIEKLKRDAGIVSAIEAGAHEGSPASHTRSHPPPHKGKRRRRSGSGGGNGSRRLAEEGPVRASLESMQSTLAHVNGMTGLEDEGRGQRSFEGGA